MADAAARREARRRRILENAEYRLQRITGHPNNSEPQDERGKNTVETQLAALNNTPNGILTTEPIMQSQTLDALINEINANIETDEPSLKAEQMYATTQGISNHVSSGQSVQNRRNPERSCITNDFGNLASFGFNNSNDLRFSLGSRDPQATSLLAHSERDTSMSNSLSVEHQSDGYLMDILSSRLVYVLLAVVVNIMVLLNLEHLFGTSIIVPFLAVVIGRLCTCRNDDASQGSNMLVAALILSNCRPDFVKVIQRLKGTFSLFGKVTRDLAVYIFTFVLLYTVISPYQENRGDPVPLSNEGEAIFADDIAM